MTTVKFVWEYVDYSGNFRKWSYTVRISEKLYKSVRSLPHSVKAEDYKLLAMEKREDKFFTSFLEDLLPKGIEVGYRVVEIAEWLLNFVAFIPYHPDPLPDRDYPRYPVETLYDHRGDCEDAAILAARLLWMLGYDVALIKLPHHMALGIAASLDDLSGTYFLYGGKSYFYAEAAGTDTGYPGIRHIGDMPEMFREVRADDIYPLPPHPRPLLANPHDLWAEPQLKRWKLLVRPVRRSRRVPQSTLPSSSSQPRKAELLRVLIWGIVLIIIVVGVYWARDGNSKVAYIPGPTEIGSAPSSLSTSQRPRPSRNTTPVGELPLINEPGFYSKKQNSWQAWVFAYELNVRSQPSASASIEGRLKRRDVVQVVSKDPLALWVQIQHPQQGWVSGVYLCFVNDKREKDVYFWVTAPRGLKVRSAPSVNAEVRGALPFKRCVTADRINRTASSTQCKKGWVHIILPREGWVCLDWLTTNPDDVLQ